MRTVYLAALTIVLMGLAGSVQADVLVDSADSALVGDLGDQQISALPTGTATQGGTEVYLSGPDGVSKTDFTYDIQGDSAVFTTNYLQHQNGPATLQTDGVLNLVFSVSVPSKFSLTSVYTDTLSDPRDFIAWTHWDEISNVDTWDMVFESGAQFTPGTITASGDLPVGTYYVFLWDAFNANNYAVSASGTATLTVTPVPEPASLSLLAAGLFGLLAYAWRRKKAT